MSDTQPSRRPQFVGLRIGLAGALLLTEAAITVSMLFPRVSDDYRAYFIEHTSPTWPPCHPPLDYVEMKDPIELAELDGGAVCVLLRDGWSLPETWGVWTDRDIAHLTLPYRPSEREATLKLIAHSRMGEPRVVQAVVDGIEVGQFSIDKSGSSIMLPLPPTNRLRIATIALRVEGAFRPRDADENNDNRKLGIGLVSIERH